MIEILEAMDGLRCKIVVDSSSDLKCLDWVPFACAPLKIITDEREYVDDEKLNVREMAINLAAYRGRSSSACPSVGDWLDAFGDAERIFCLTITGTLSGSYNSACIAKEEYEERWPDRCVYVMNTLTAGPEIALIAEFIRDRIMDGDHYTEICVKAMEYSTRTSLLFMLESMNNLANNGRVKPIVAKAAGLLGIRVVGKASAKGDLEPLDKSRGEGKALAAIVHRMKSMNYAGGKVKIAHCLNETAAERLRGMILAEMPDARVEIYPAGGLCSYYAEKGGLLIGFEREAE